MRMDLTFAGMSFTLLSASKTAFAIHWSSSPSVLNSKQAGIGNEAGSYNASTLESFFSFLSSKPAIDNIGPRRLAGTISGDNHIMDMKIPLICKAYIDYIHSQDLENFLYHLPSAIHTKQVPNFLRLL